MTVPIPVTGTTIESDWGIAVANDLNGLSAVVAPLNAANLPSRVTALEGQAVRYGIWWQRTTTASVPSSPAPLTNTATVSASSGWSVSGGVVTIPVAGWYLIDARLTIGGAGDVPKAWITKNAGTYDRQLNAVNTYGGIGRLEGSAVMYLTAGNTIAIYNQAGASAFITDADVTITRLAAP